MLFLSSILSIVVLGACAFAVGGRMGHPAGVTAWTILATGLGWVVGISYEPSSPLAKALLALVCTGLVVATPFSSRWWDIATMSWSAHSKRVILALRVVAFLGFALGGIVGGLAG